jgi:hypothetical protein
LQQSLVFQDRKVLSNGHGGDGKPLRKVVYIQRFFPVQQVQYGEATLVHFKTPVPFFRIAALLRSYETPLLSIITEYEAFSYFPRNRPPEHFVEPSRQCRPHRPLFAGPPIAPVPFVR